jgi:hypothetical protein
MHNQLQAIIMVLSLINLAMFARAVAGQSLAVLSPDEDILRFDACAGSVNEQLQARERSGFQKD